MQGACMRYLLVLALTLLAIPASAERPQIQEYTLDNGMRVIVRPDHRAPVATSMVWYRIGSSYEELGSTGISHVLEHMMFKGTTRYPAGEFSHIIAQQGGRENAFTGRDFTAYFQQLAADRLPKIGRASCREGGQKSVHNANATEKDRKTSVEGQNVQLA